MQTRAVAETPSTGNYYLAGLAMLVPYSIMFAAFVVYPVGYGIYLASSPASYFQLWRDPDYLTAVSNTLLILVLAVNLKMALALLISGFFLHPYAWVRWLSVIFLLPWAIPSLISVLSIRWMLNAEWGMVNNIWFLLTAQDGPQWLLHRSYALASIIYVHIWKSLPFWTLILLAARLGIPKELYEAARVDGANAYQRFVNVTVPSIWGTYLTSTVLSTVWNLGDFSTVYLLTGGGPGSSTQVFATLGIRYAFQMNDVRGGVAIVATALPLLIPLTMFLMRRLKSKESVAT